MPDLDNLSAAVDELAGRASAFDADELLAGLDRRARHQRPPRAVTLVAAVVVVIVIAVLVPLLATRGKSQAPQPVAAGCGTADVSPDACATALQAAHAAANRGATGRRATGTGWPSGIGLVTTDLRTGTVRQANAGPPCTSGRLLVINEYGSFRTVVAPPPVAPGHTPPATDVVEVEVTADAATGKPCRVAVSTGDPTASAQPPKDAAVIYRSGQVTVTGSLREVGGPAPGLNRPVAGRIEVYDNSKAVVTSVRVGKNGRFTVKLPAGRYTFRSAASSTGGFGCGGGSAILIGPGLPNRVEVICQLQ